MTFKLYLLTCVFVTHQVAAITDLSQCELELKPVGCTSDHDDGKRVNYPDLIMNGRDKTSTVFVEPVLDWIQYDQWLSNFICECAKKLFAKKKAKKQDTISIEFYGECWVNLKKRIQLDTYARSPNCITSGFNPISENINSCIPYSGINFSGFVYKVAKRKDKTCPIYHESRSCYAINDPTKVMERFLISTAEVKISESACVCAKAAKTKGYRYFGIFYDDECWGSRNPVANLTVSQNCFDEMENQCKPSGESCRALQCVGNYESIQMFEVTQGPLGCTNNPCENGGTCLTKGLSDFRCKCKGKYTGKHCETDPEKCKDCDKLN